MWLQLWRWVWVWLGVWLGVWVWVEVWVLLFGLSLFAQRIHVIAKWKAPSYLLYFFKELHNLQVAQFFFFVLAASHSLRKQLRVWLDLCQIHTKRNNSNNNSECSTEAIRTTRWMDATFVYMYIRSTHSCIELQFLVIDSLLIVIYCIWKIRENVDHYLVFGKKIIKTYNKS